jgi:CheY-like chemotaxis protein
VHTSAAAGAAPGAVLVVDDVPLNRAILGRMVCKATGRKVVEAANGAEALKLVTCAPPGAIACILLDLQVL